MSSPTIISSPDIDSLLLPHSPDFNDSPSSKTRISPSNRIPNASSQHIIDSQPDQSPPTPTEDLISSPQKRHRKSSSASASAAFEEEPCYNEIYDRIDKYFDQQKLFYISPSPLNSHKNVLTLKACPKLERSLESASTEASTNPGSMNLDSLSCGKNLAMPSFLAKRGSLQKTKSERSFINSTRAKTCGIFTNNSETEKIEKSSFSKFNFLSEGTKDC